jgi:hypothetical protein
MRLGDWNRLLKAAKAHGFVVELPDGTRLRPADLTDEANAPSPTDPLDAELAEWAAKHGYA